MSRSVETFRKEFKLTATAVNSSNGGCKIEVLDQIVREEHQIVLISPEMALSRRFIRHVLHSSEFGRRIMSVVVDEAHVVSHWGASFRKKYGTLGTLRAFLPRGTPVVALSATLPARIRSDVLSKLQFCRDYINIDVGNDRPNVSLIVRAIQHPIHTYADLNFIAAGIKTRADIKKTFIYADNIATGYDVPFRPYNAALSKEYRKKAMTQFKDGHVRILVCTDAAGMGCNIPDIDVVVQWKLPASMSIFVQRPGRAARAHGSRGVAILLVEPSVYSVDLAEGIAKASGVRGKKKGQEKEKESEAAKKLKAKKRKDHANARGVHHGGVGGKHDAIFIADTPPLDPEAEDEGLRVFVQTGECRRAVLTQIYENRPSPLLDQTRPGKAPVVPRQSAVKRGEINQDVQLVLHKWRVEIKTRDYPTPLFSASGILRDETIALLSSVGPINSRQYLEAVLSGQWTWWEKYGEELFACLSALDIPPMKPLPPKKRGKKRVADEPAKTSEAPGVPITSKHQHLQEPPIAEAATESSTKRRQRAPAKTAEEIRALNAASFLQDDMNRTAAFFSTLRSSQLPQNSNSSSQ
ncbi:P-loop containing nucleoside triphosphate hydrolase protein [Mycena albidolilacea]|uniref:DNA 3'-5' helicase n=1 Tax=Mycena albidolilacea TaxID=1033008 RepID=A0AAD7F3S6_9AGAR|nr:P-loop containing nucleoside triphosphate hydrolase protein [Mycena albidolilacea]